jgi:hypothetical protein
LRCWPAAAVPVFGHYRTLARRQVIRIAAWRPRSPGRGGNSASPPRKCRRYPIVCSHVPIPAPPHPRPESGAVGPLRPDPVRVEPRRRTALPLAPRPQGRPGYLEQCRLSHEFSSVSRSGTDIAGDVSRLDLLGRRRSMRLVLNFLATSTLAMRYG